MTNTKPIPAVGTIVKIIHGDFLGELGTVEETYSLADNRWGVYVVINSSGKVYSFLDVDVELLT